MGHTDSPTAFPRTANTCTATKKIKSLALSLINKSDTKLWSDRGTASIWVKRGEQRSQRPQTPPRRNGETSAVGAKWLKNTPPFSGFLSVQTSR